MTERLPRILYVDDEVFNLELFKLTYKNHYDVIVASSGPEALQMMDASDDIRLIVSDMNMPLMNGLEFIAEAKKVKPELPMVILSGYMRTETIDRAIDSGLIEEYFMKPLKREELIHFISEKL
ncbi:response regulator [Marinoscillum sp. MHG1-6]|uniref:response regulator n=1 Tax=Marinoscillum sp. MHG1-6 TaxID=2959627 RepID=UPI002157B02C|nr:response regulator [Marinoscillum sp. MHG1-6]